MIDKQPIQYNTHLVKYYDENGLVRATGVRGCSSKESSESIINEFGKDIYVIRIEKIDLETGEVEEWDRDEFTYGKNINNEKRGRL